MAKKLKITVTDDVEAGIKASLLSSVVNLETTASALHARIVTLKADLQSLEAQLVIAKAKAKEGRDAYDSAVTEQQQ